MKVGRPKGNLRTSKATDCYFCEGSGFHFSRTKPCEACDGTGKEKVRKAKQRVYNAKNDLPANYNLNPEQ